MVAAVIGSTLTRPSGHTDVVAAGLSALPPGERRRLARPPPRRAVRRPRAPRRGRIGVARTAAGIGRVAHPDDQHELATGRDAAVGHGAGEVAQRASYDLLVELGELPRDGTLSLGRRRPSPGRAGSRPPARAPRTGRSRADRPRWPPAGRAARARSVAGTPRTPSVARPRPTQPPPPARPMRPGSARRVPPSPAQAATRSAPGSLTAGVPASVTSARSSPSRRCVESASRRAGGAPSVVAGRAASSIPCRSSSRRVSRVSSAAISGTAPQHLDRPQRDVGQIADGRGDDVQRAARARGHSRAEPGRRRGYR